MTPPVPPLERVRTLRDWCDPALKDTRCRQPPNCWEDLTAILQDYLRRVEAEEWRPGTELPTHDGLYEVAYSEPWPHPIDVLEYRGAAHEGHGHWMTGENTLGYVIAWRPLPPPPEAASSALEGEK